MIALAAEPRTSTALLRAPVTDPAAAVLARVRAILGRRRITDPDCHCATCQRVMAQPFRCEDCGYTGRPTTYGCTCRRNLDEKLSFNRIALARAQWPADWKTRRVDVVRETARLRRVSHQIRHVETCEGEGRGMPDVGDALFSWEDCVHGVPSCPVCEGGGRGETILDGPTSPFTILREVNAVLCADAPRPASVPTIRVRHREQREGDVTLKWREVRAERQPVDGAVIELAIAEDLYGMTDSFFLEASGTRPGDTSLGVFLSAAELDRTIDTLVALRERAKAEGVLP